MQEKKCEKSILYSGECFRSSAHPHKKGKPSGFSGRTSLKAVKQKTKVRKGPGKGKDNKRAISTLVTRWQQKYTI